MTSSNGFNNKEIPDNIFNNATTNGNNIMINTGPVTSHTVLLNLFPTTHTDAEKKQRSAMNHFKKDMKRIQKVYGAGSGSIKT